MTQRQPSFFRRLGRDQLFWLIVGGLFLVYAVLEIRAVLPFLFAMLALLVAVTIHECAHAWSADQLGDPTARMLGRVSLNPLVHLDPLGTVMMIITALTGYGIGWGKPTPVTPYRLRYGSRRGLAIVSLGGPASNLLVAAVLGLILRLAGRPSVNGWYIYLFFLLQTIVRINVVIAIFNLLPLPPLDGHAVLIGLLSLSQAQVSWRIIAFLESLERYGSMLLFGLILVSQFLGLNLIGRIIGPPTNAILRLILGPAM
ncbi:MAG: site-2 protease family protein [Anaerolineae bacterium]|nr:site-2 protease family protein [Anaerolineae bacterium]